MDPRILMFLCNTNGMTDQEVAMSKTLLSLYMGGLVEAEWQDGEPLFSIDIVSEEEYVLAYAHKQQVIEE